MRKYEEYNRLERWAYWKGYRFGEWLFRLIWRRSQEP